MSPFLPGLASMIFPVWGSGFGEVDWVMGGDTERINGGGLPQLGTTCCGGDIGGAPRTAFTACCVRDNDEGGSPA